MLNQDGDKVYEGHSYEIESIDGILVHGAELKARLGDDNNGEQWLEDQRQQRINTKDQAKALLLQIASHLRTVGINFNSLKS